MASQARAVCSSGPRAVSRYSGAAYTTNATVLFARVVNMLSHVGRTPRACDAALAGCTLLQDGPDMRRRCRRRTAPDSHIVRAFKLVAYQISHLFLEGPMGRVYDALLGIIDTQPSTSNGLAGQSVSVSLRLRVAWSGCLACSEGSWGCSAISIEARCLSESGGREMSWCACAKFSAGLFWRRCGQRLDEYGVLL